MQSFDQLHRYIFDKANVRGELVRLQQSYQTILDSYHYPSVIQDILGELMAAASMLTATLKFEGDIALQLQGEGLINYVVINATDKQELRGVARWDESQTDALPTEFADLFPKGVLTITITPTKGERYQGMVALDKPSLAECLQAYFEQSEQLPTKLHLFTGEVEGKAVAGGLFLQVLPQSSEITNVTEDTEFEHLSTLTETLTKEELFTLSVNDILYRLYHQDEVQVFAPHNVVFKCTCSKERSATALLQVGKEELLQIIAEDGDIKMNCQYCHSDYRFDAIDVEAIHNGQFPATRLQ